MPWILALTRFADAALLAALSLVVCAILAAFRVYLALRHPYMFSIAPSSFSSALLRSLWV